MKFKIYPQLHHCLLNISKIRVHLKAQYKHLQQLLKSVVVAVTVCKLKATCIYQLPIIYYQFINKSGFQSSVENDLHWFGFCTESDSQCVIHSKVKTNHDFYFAAVPISYINLLGVLTLYSLRVTCRFYAV